MTPCDLRCYLRFVMNGTIDHSSKGRIAENERVRELWYWADKNQMEKNRLVMLSDDQLMNLWARFNIERIAEVS